MLDTGTIKTNSINNTTIIATTMTTIIVVMITKSIYTSLVLLKPDG